MKPDKKIKKKKGGSFKAEESVIRAAKIKAFTEEGKSLSKLVEDYLIKYISK